MKGNKYKRFLWKRVFGNLFGNPEVQLIFAHLGSSSKMFFGVSPEMSYSKISIEMSSLYFGLDYQLERYILQILTMNNEYLINKSYSVAS